MGQKPLRQAITRHRGLLWGRCDHSEAAVISSEGFGRETFILDAYEYTAEKHQGGPETCYRHRPSVLPGRTAPCC